MRREFFLLSVAILLVFTVIDCDNGGIVVVDQEWPELPSLAGTSWRLAAIVGAEGDACRKPDYGRSGYRDDAYTLTFVSDTVMWARNEANTISGRYSVDYNTNTLVWHSIITTDMCCDEGDGRLYASVFSRPLRFELYYQKLHMFYNDDKEVMMFNRIDYIEGGFYGH